MNPVNDTTTIITAPCSGPILVGPDNSVVDCLFCKQTVRTTVKFTDNSGTHMAAAIWGKICCCVCLPYCSEDAKNADHYCPKCQKYLGTYRRF